jgi:hypothetical protein
MILPKRLCVFPSADDIYLMPKADSSSTVSHLEQLQITVWLIRGAHQISVTLSLLQLESSFTPPSEVYRRQIADRGIGGCPDKIVLIHTKEEQATDQG